MSARSSTKNKKPTQTRALQKKVLDLGMLFLLAAVLVAAGVISGIVGMRLAVRKTEVVVPAIVGLTLDQAAADLTELQLEVKVMGERYDDQYPKGEIISQYPPEGGRIKAGRYLQVVVSLGRRTHAVPDLLGSTVRVAQLTAAQYSYGIGHITRISYPGVDEDVVIQQDPEAGSTSATDSRISLLVSEGPPGRFSMPDLRGRNLNEVEPFLNTRGFEVESITYRFYRGVVKGTVVKQYPEPGNLLLEGDPVNLEVAR